jgi:hypothetical protein
MAILIGRESDCNTVQNYVKQQKSAFHAQIMPNARDLIT